MTNKSLAINRQSGAKEKLSDENGERFRHSAGKMNAGWFAFPLCLACPRSEAIGWKPSSGNDQSCHCHAGIQRASYVEYGKGRRLVHTLCLY